MAPSLLSPSSLNTSSIFDTQLSAKAYQSTSYCFALFNKILKVVEMLMSSSIFGYDKLSSNLSKALVMFFHSHFGKESIAYFKYLLYFFKSANKTGSFKLGAIRFESVIGYPPYR